MYHKSLLPTKLTKLNPLNNKKISPFPKKVPKNHPSYKIDQINPPSSKIYKGKPPSPKK
jgi:hypothetical protein